MDVTWPFRRQRMMIGYDIKAGGHGSSFLSIDGAEDVPIMCPHSKPANMSSIALAFFLFFVLLAPSGNAVVRPAF